MQAHDPQCVELHASHTIHINDGHGLIDTFRRKAFSITGIAQHIDCATQTDFAGEFIQRA